MYVSHDQAYIRYHVLHFRGPSSLVLQVQERTYIIYYILYFRYLLFFLV